TAPGVNILAAARAEGGNPNQYGLLQGTSMSSPHAAGSAALLRALHPDWTPAEVRSALASTADPEGLLAPDGVTPATQFNYGSGRIDLTSAARIGLVMDETHANFVAANPAIGGDPKTLNLPAFINHECSVCSWDRTVRSVADTTATYTAVVDSPTDMEVTVTPSSFTIAPGATVDFTVEVDATGLPEGDWAFADVRFVTTGSHANGQSISSVHDPIGVLAAPAQDGQAITVDPEELASTQGPDQQVTRTPTIGNAGGSDLTWSVFENGPSGVVLPSGGSVVSGPVAVTG